MSTEPRKQALRFFYTKAVEPLGFKFTPDAELAEYLLDQEVALEARHGIPFCPCRPIRRDRARDMQIVCPCIPFHRRHFDAMKRCWCMFCARRHRSDRLPQMSPKELGLSERFVRRRADDIAPGGMKAVS
jgi:ferredoxin-thioredoxin reductase catalytic subunit